MAEKSGPEHGPPPLASTTAATSIRPETAHRHGLAEGDTKVSAVIHLYRDWNRRSKWDIGTVLRKSLAALLASSPQNCLSLRTGFLPANTLDTSNSSCASTGRGAAVLRPISAQSTRRVSDSCHRHRQSFCRARPPVPSCSAPRSRFRPTRFPGIVQKSCKRGEDFTPAHECRARFPMERTSLLRSYFVCAVRIVPKD